MSFLIPQTMLAFPHPTVFFIMLISVLFFPLHDGLCPFFPTLELLDTPHTWHSACSGQVLNTR